MRFARWKRASAPSRILIFHEAGLRASDGAADIAGLRGAGHNLLHFADYVDEFKERRFAAPPLLKRMVLAGWNGRKSGRGFYDYSDPQKPKALKF